jgi:hypothetical protein
MIDALLTFQDTLGGGRCEFRILNPRGAMAAVVLALLSKSVNATGDKRGCANGG